MRIGLLGFGVVGRGVYDLIKDIPDMQVVQVLCLEDITLPDAHVTKNFGEVLADPTVDTVVEALGGIHPSFEFVKAALEAGKHVVTSNKALVAACYDQLIPLAQEKGLCLRCTAAVGGGIGWLSELERTRRTQKLHTVGGIMNGTCNYILDSMTRLNLGYDEALKQAQLLGYAERNPTTDVEGIDTWHKTLLSANIGFGVSLDSGTVPLCGISAITARDIATFREKGLVCKLVGKAQQDEAGISAWVQPTLFPQGALEAAVPLNFNLITLEGEASGRMSFYGQGAGRYPTAHNVVQDLTDVSQGRGFYGSYGPKQAAVNEVALPYYVRGGKRRGLPIREVWGAGVLTEPMSVARLHAWLKENPGAFAAAVQEG